MRTSGEGKRHELHGARSRPGGRQAPLAIETVALAKRFGTGRALDGLDLAVPPGTVYGLLGPNGAGKTTTVRILATLLAPDAGSARVLGHDVAREADAVRRRIALAGQSATTDDDLTGTENLVLLGRLAGLGRKAARGRAAELVTAFGLEAAAARQVKSYSGGMRRRLDLAASILVRADVYFLDEPTTGLDPASRAGVHDIVRSVAADGATVLLTTQYLDEADQLASRVAVIDHGRVVAEGTPASSRPASAPGRSGSGWPTRRNGRGRGRSCPGCSASPSMPRPIRRRWSARPAGGQVPPRCPGWPARASRSASSPSASPAWTRCSSPSPATRRYRR